MVTKKAAPVNLNLFTIRFPVAAIASILHRISGVFLFLLIPFLLWGFNLSLSSAADFDHLAYYFSETWVKFVLWIMLSAFVYHAVAGLRHLLMDIGVGESLRGGRLSALVTFIASALLVVIVGIWLW